MKTTVKMIYLIFILFLPKSAIAAEPLVDVVWVKENLQAEGVVFLDVTSNMQVFKKAHIPGAIFTHYQKDQWRVAGKKRGKKVPGLLPSASHLQKLIRRLGIENTNHVVVVPAGRSAADMGIATRIYWTFKVVGHDKISILNGGMNAYRAAKLPLIDRMTVRAPTSFKIKSDYSYLATESDLLKSLEQGEKIIDSRTSAQYLGINKSGRVQRAGTLPSAVNIPGEYLTVNKQGVFRSKKAIAKLYSYLEVPSNTAAITFCNTGHWASIGWFVHSEILGNKNTRMYDGSMAEYTTNKNANLIQRFRLDI